jgi:glyoxylase-like metal-dependent hydrolase (beta-lactamase superfamily II)
MVGLADRHPGSRHFLKGSNVADYEVIAIRYGQSTTLRSRTFHRYQTYGELDGPMQMDYFFWVIRNEHLTVLVDTGYDPQVMVARKPGQSCLVPPLQALSDLGIDRESVSTVILSHFHYDHIGNVASFPNARIIVQRRELDFWTGPYADRPTLCAVIEPSEVQFLRQANEQGQVELIDGASEVVPGVTAQLVGGHCPGQQIVIVKGKSPIVLASDAVHFYEELDRDMPFSGFTDLPAMYQTYETLRELQDRDGAVIVAGHDPAVMLRFPPLAGAPAGIAVHLN